MDPKDQIKERLDIVEVIREYVPLKNAGANWKGLCPFHQEKTPSFMVSPDRQSFRCFGCNVGGDVFSFVMEKEGMEFPEVLRMFGERLGIELRRGDATTRNAKTGLLDIMDAATTWWYERLMSSEGGDARAYLKKRGITKEVAEHWRIGFAPKAWDRLSHFLAKKGFSIQDILASGAVIERQRGGERRDLPFYDRFRGRIMFPIRDTRGQTVGAGGRILHEDTNRPEGKYINTPETIIYHKSRVLYGLDHARAIMKETKTAVLVEGYMDVIASHRAGVKNAVAVSGTALTEEHVVLLKRFADTVAIRFDEDEAGARAARRSLHLLLRAGFAVHVIDLPEGVKDPGECVERRPEDFKHAADTATPFFAHAFERARQRDLSNVATKKEITRDFLSLIALLPDPVERGHYVRALAGLVNVQENLLLEALERSKSTYRTPPKPLPSSQPEKQSRHEALSERVVALILHEPKHIDFICKLLSPEMFAPGPYRDLYTDCKNAYTRNNASFDPRSIIGDRSLLDRLAFAAEQYFGSFDANELVRERDALVHAVAKHATQAELSSLQQIIASSDDRAATLAALARVQELTRQLKSFL